MRLAANQGRSFLNSVKFNSVNKDSKTEDGCINSANAAVHSP